MKFKTYSIELAKHNKPTIDKKNNLLYVWILCVACFLRSFCCFARVFFLFWRINWNKIEWNTQRNTTNVEPQWRRERMLFANHFQNSKCLFDRFNSLWLCVFCFVCRSKHLNGKVAKVEIQVEKRKKSTNFLVIFAASLEFTKLWLIENHLRSWIIWSKIVIDLFSIL